MRTITHDITDWVQLVRAEYLEMPGLHLTKPQVQRLWGLDATTCDVILRTLIDKRFLRRANDGGYIRAHD
jgi:hypothetical protein